MADITMQQLKKLRTQLKKHTIPPVNGYYTFYCRNPKTVKAEYTRDWFLKGIAPPDEFKGL